MNLNQVIQIINTIPLGTVFQFTDYFDSGNPGTNKLNGRRFKENVKNGNIMNIRILPLSTDRHDRYEKI